MARRRRAIPQGYDPRAEYLDRLTTDPAGVRAERESRAREFWATRAAVAAKQLAEFEPLLGVLRSADLTGARAKADAMRLAVMEAAGRAGVDSAGLLAEARARVARQDDDATAGNGRAAPGDVVDVTKVAEVAEA